MNEQRIESKIMTVVTPSLEEVQVEVLMFFGFKDIGKKYLVYTRHEKNETAMFTIYASQYIEENGEIYLENIESEEEWLRVKEVMRDVIKNGEE